jgi:hypothetical protein
VAPPLLNAVLTQDLETHRLSWDVADFDCTIEYTVPDLQTIRNFMSDPEFLQSIKDQDDWVDTTKPLNSLGYSTPYLLETGEVVNMPK